MSELGVRRDKAALFSGCEPHPATFGGGSTTMGDTRHRHLLPCSGTSIRRYWLGRCGSSSASKHTRRVRAISYKNWHGEARISSYIGALEWSARLP